MTKKIILISALFILPLLIVTPTFAAENFAKRELIILPENEVVEKDYFATGERILIQGTVNGDAYLAGGNVTVQGDINGDLLVAGGEVNIMGKVKNDVRSAGGKITISGEVGGNTTSVGGQVNITNSAKINGSLTTAAGSLIIAGPIGRDATIGAGDVIISNSIDGDVNAGVGQITIHPKSNIAGNLTYWSESDAQILQGAQISGSTTHNFPQEDSKRDDAKIFGAFVITWRAINFLASLLIGLLFLKFLPVFTAKTVQNVRQKSFSNLGKGLIFLVGSLLGSLVLMMTIIGSPLGLLLLVGVIFSIYISKIFVGLAVGQKLLAAEGKNKSITAGMLIVGLMVYFILKFIPIVGFLTSTIVVLVGIGAIVSTKKELYKQLSQKRLL